MEKLSKIDWQERISNNDTEIDLFEVPLYTMLFNKSSYKKVYGYDVEIPVAPMDHECINYGLTEYDQIFRRTKIPEDLIHWDIKEKEQFIADEYHRRKNGIWIFIGGEKIYITGVFYFFLNYWHLQTGKKPIYRESDNDFFTIWLHVVRSPNIFGLLVFKCRRIGDTEKSLAVIDDFASRVKNTLNGLSDCRKFDEVLLTYARLTYAHQKMVWFMKPINRGSSNPRSSLEFKHPETKESVKKIHNKNSKDANVDIEFEFDALNSEIIPYSSTPSATDGKRHGRLYFDEFGKCFGRGTEVLMYDGFYKRVEYVRVGDVLMGNDSSPVKVLNTIHSQGEMYRIEPVAGGWESYTCTLNHTLSLKWCLNMKYHKWKKNEIVNISLKDYFTLSNNDRRSLCLYRTDVEYSTKKVSLDPYLLGVWLGDGASAGPYISNPEPEILKYAEEYCSNRNMYVKHYDDLTYGLSSHSKKHGANYLRKGLQDYALMHNKNIPNDYLLNDRDTRLKLLAGLLDTDGYLMSSGNGYEITQIKKRLSFQIHKLVLELGFKSTIVKKKTSMRRYDGSYYKGEAYRISIFGLNLYEIPCIVSRKRVLKKDFVHKNTRDSQKTCFNVKAIGVEEYFGFEVDGNSLFMLKDCQVVHNCKTLNPIDAWRFGKLSLMDLITEEIIGKAIFTSTIEQEPGTKSEDMSKFLEVSRQMWDDANPEILNEKGQTTSGLIRIVRGALERGKPDRFGRTDKERLRKEIEAQKKFLLENRKWKDLIEFGRQNCIDEQDIFASMTGDSNFNVENLTQREHRLRYEKGLAKWVRGNFHWVNGKKFGDVYWQPNENGRFVVSGHPKDWGLKANAKSAFSKKPKPKNIHAFCAGIDPVSQKDVLEKNPSKGGLVIKRKFDPTFDSGKFDEDGDPLNGGEQFSTNRYVCALLWRWAEPTQNYEDWAMALIYYGSDFLIEKNHSAGFQTYMEGADLDGYYMDNSKGVKNHAGQVESWGVSANEKSIDYYFSLLSTITNKWWNTIDIPVILDQLKSMNVENRGSKDVGVAAGICEIAAQRDLPKPKDREKESNTHFPEIIV